MEKNEKKQEQKNRVVEAMLRAREKEMQQGTPEEELPSLSPGEYEDMYQKILSRLKAEGLMDEDRRTYGIVFGNRSGRQFRNRGI